MAKKNENNDHVLTLIGYGLVFICAILLFLAQVAVVFGPLVLLCYIIITSLIGWYQYKKVDLPFVKRKFHLLDRELNLLHDNNQKIDAAIDKIKECERIVAEEHLHINKDGRISSKSHRGVEVQGALDHAHQIINEIKPISDYLVSLPMQRYKKARKDYLRFKGGIYSCVFALILCLIFVLAYYNQDSIDSIMGYINTFKIPDSFDGVWSIVWVYSVILIPSYILARLIVRIYFSIRNKKPQY